jgi:tetratricopeptide (TPR) repeat protein
MFNWFKKTDSATKTAPDIKTSDHHDNSINTTSAISESIALKDQGNALLGEGKLDEAAKCYRHAIELNPNYAEAYTNLGVISQSKGNLNEAAALYRQAVSLNPDLLPAHLNLSSVLINMGQFAEAEGSLRRVVVLAPEHAGAWQSLGVMAAQRGDFQQAESMLRRTLELQPDYAEAYNNLGNLLKQSKRLTEAEISYRRAIELQPDNPRSRYNLGNLLKEAKNLPEAEACYRCALELKPDYVDAHNNLGLLLMETKRLPEAENSFRRALELKPNFAETHNNLGLLFKEAKRLTEAEAAYRRALEFKPDYAEALLNLGTLLKENQRTEEAEISYHMALRLKPDYAEAQYNLGILLMESRRFEEAERQYRDALRIKPDLAEAHTNLGILLTEIQRLTEAEDSYRRALEHQPNYAEAHYNLGSLLLSLGRYAEAWTYYEHRYNANIKKDGGTLPLLPFPQWRGESLKGKSLLLWPEQGYGDYIQFARYAGLLRDSGVSHLTLLCAPPLKPLLETVDGVDEVITKWDHDSLHDYWSLPLSLPLYLGTKLDSIPARQPYMHALANRREKWRARFPSGKLKVGLVWKGNADHKNDANRSLPGLVTLAPLWTVPEVTFFSLQKGQGEEEATKPPLGQQLIHLGSDIGDFADTAAILDQLDLVICVDTAIAHVAGALGKPCWVLLPALGTDWRWLRERGDSPWYPSIRLFRQQAPNEWDRLVEEIRQALLARLDSSC